VGRRSLRSDHGATDIDGEIIVERLARLICQRGLSQRGRIEVQNIYSGELAFNLRYERCDARRFSRIDRPYADLMALRLELPRKLLCPSWSRSERSR